MTELKLSLIFQDDITATGSGLGNSSWTSGQKSQRVLKHWLPRSCRISILGDFQHPDNILSYWFNPIKVEVTLRAGSQHAWPPEVPSNKHFNIYNTVIAETHQCVYFYYFNFAIVW